MKYNVSGKMLVKFYDVIEIEGGENMDDETLKETLRDKFWHNVDCSIHPEYNRGAGMGNMHLQTFVFKEADDE